MPVNQAALVSEPSPGGPAPGATERRPEIIYARVLDGDTLWLAATGVDSTDGQLALRNRKTEELIVMPTEVHVHRGQIVLSTRFHLTSTTKGMPPVGRAAFGVRVIDHAYSEPLSTWMAPLAPESPTKTPRSRDGRWQFKLNVHNGFLGVVREPREESALAVSFRLTDSGVEVTVEAPDRFAAPLLLVLDDDVVLHSMALRASSDGLHSVSFGNDDIPDTPGASYRLAVGTAEDHVPIFRRRNDLTTPNNAVLLPLVMYLDASPHHPFRLKWMRTGQLSATRSLEQEWGSEGEEVAQEDATLGAAP